MSVREVFNTLSRFHFFPHHLRDLFLARFFFDIGQAINLIAGPIWLFQAGQRFPWWQSLPLEDWAKGLLTVMVYVILMRLTQVLISPLVIPVFRRLGLTHTLILGEMFMIVRFLPALEMNTYPSLFLITAFLSGLSVHFFWTSYHVLFTTEVVEPEIGMEVGSAEFLIRLAQVIAPLVSTLAIVAFGYTATFAIATIFFLISICFLLRLPNFFTKAHWSWQVFWEWLKQHDHGKILTSISGLAWEEVGFGILWPIFLLVSYGNLESVGYVLSGATLLSLLIVYLSGWVFDHRQNSNRWQQMSGFLAALLWIPRILFIHSPLVIVLNDALDRLVHSVYGTMFYATVVTRARGKKVIQFYINREVAISFGNILGALITIILLFLQWSWAVLFASFMIGIFISLPLQKERKP